MPKALVVDDEQNLRRVLAAMLKREGFDVAVAENGVQALAEKTVAMNLLQYGVPLAATAWGVYVLFRRQPGAQRRRKSPPARAALTPRPA
jgi:CheY-like chemotaxis protein